MQKEELQEILARQKKFSASGRTFDISFRIKALTRLEQSILKYEDRLSRALQADLGKSEAESYMCEIGLKIGRASCRERV